MRHTLRGFLLFLQLLAAACLCGQVLHPNPQWPTDQEFLNVNQAVESASRRYPQVEQELVWALVWEESKYDPLASGLKGELGLGQLMPQTARALGVHDRTNIQESVEATVRHLFHLLTKYNSNRPLALAAYNAGEPIVDRCRCVPTASRGYVNRIEQNRFFAMRIVQYVRTTLVPAANQQAQIRDLQTQLALLEREKSRVPDAQRAGSSFQAELARIQTALQSAQSDAERLQVERDQLRTQLEQENSLGAQALAMTEYLRHRLEEVEKRVGSVSPGPKPNGDVSEEVDSLRVEIAEVKTAIQGRSLQDNQTQQHMADLSTAVARLSDLVHAASSDKPRPLVSAGTTTSSGQPLIALLVVAARDGRFEPDPALTGALQDTLLGRGVNVNLELQTPGFFGSNLASLLAGDGKSLQKVKAKKGPNWDYVVVLKVTGEPGPNGLTETTSYTIASDSRLYSAKGNLIAMRTFSGIGAGFSEAQAHQMATTRLGQTVGEYLAAALPH